MISDKSKRSRSRCNTRRSSTSGNALQRCRDGGPSSGTSGQGTLASCKASWIFGSIGCGQPSSRRQVCCRACRACGACCHWHLLHFLRHSRQECRHRQPRRGYHHSLHHHQGHHHHSFRHHQGHHHHSLHHTLHSRHLRRRHLSPRSSLSKTSRGRRRRRRRSQRKMLSIGMLC